MSSKRVEDDWPPIPNGWFAVAWSDELKTGEVQRSHYFGEDLVLFRTRSGQVQVLDAYCAHLGAHLGEGGAVFGENIQCPFHHWQYQRDGKCVGIPYAKKIPPRACVRSWPTIERNGMIMAWHHAQGDAPFYDVPDLPEFSDPEWTPPRHFDLHVAVHMQDMAENNCDPVHFKYVHSSLENPESAIEYDNNGLFMRMISNVQKELPGGGQIEVKLERESWGLGSTAVRLVGMPGAGLMMFSSTSPIDRGHTLSRWAFSVTKNLADTAGEEFIASMEKGVEDDRRIWENKVYHPRPVLCDGDTFLGPFRTWAKQFYSEVPS